MNALAKKLQMKAGQHWLLYNAPENYAGALNPLPEQVQLAFEAQGVYDGVQLFVKDSGELASALQIVAPVLKPTTVFWVIYPKKTSGIKTDLALMSSWSELDKYRLTSVAAAAVNDTWTALRFKPAELTKASDVRNENIKQNEFSEYIDVENKTITLPQELKTILEQNPAALANYEKLSYSNRKEYVLWVLTAKQDKTKQERLAKSVEKLAAGKKNPSEK